MNEKFMNVKRVALPAMTALFLAFQAGTVSLPASAEDADLLAEAIVGMDELVMDASTVDISSFTDYYVDGGHGKIQGHWAENDIGVLVGKDGIKGIPNDDGTLRFEANSPVTVAQFLGMIWQAYGVDVNSIWTNDSYTWDQKIMWRSVGDHTNKAERDRIEKNLEYIIFDYENQWIKARNEPLTREKMAWLLWGAAKNLQGDTTQWNNLENLHPAIHDIGNVSDRLFYVDDVKEKTDRAVVYGEWTDIGEKQLIQRRIETLYALGILNGDNNGNFNPQDTLTRAEATAVINRLFKYTPRLDTSLAQSLDVYSGLSRETIELYNSEARKASAETIEKKLHRTSEEYDEDIRKQEATLGDRESRWNKALGLE